MRAAMVDVVVPFTQTTIPPRGNTMAWVTIPRGRQKAFVPAGRIKGPDDLLTRALKDTLQTFKTDYSIFLRYLGLWVSPDQCGLVVTGARIGQDPAGRFDVEPRVYVWPERPLHPDANNGLRLLEGDEVWFELRNDSDEPISLRAGGMLCTLSILDAGGTA